MKLTPKKSAHERFSNNVQSLPPFLYFFSFDFHGFILHNFFIFNKFCIKDCCVFLC